MHKADGPSYDRCMKTASRAVKKTPKSFQDLPPIKFGEDFGPLPRADVIPLKEVK